LSRGPLSVTVTAAGEIERGRAVLRSGLRLGDQLWVTGAPGLARLGLMALQRKLGAGQTSPQLRRAVAAFRRPTARLTEARYLSRRWLISAMIDLSDGLGRDLGHLLAASSQASGRPLGAILDDDAFRGIRPLDAAARAAGLSPSSVAIAGGEDYEILFAAPPSRTASRQRRVFVRRHAVDLTRIGEVVAMRGLWLRRVDGELEAIKADSSFAHFGS
jgi:thiamine-monophosphate kinase